MSYVREAGVRYAIVLLPSSALLPSMLTRAERDIVTRVLAGESNATIARARRVSTSTVANQIYSVMQKLGVGSRAALIAYVLRSQT